MRCGGESGGGSGRGAYRVTNRTRGSILGDRVRRADSFLARLRGLLGTRELPPGGGLWIAPCRSVHTFGMRYPIDVVFVGRDGAVVGQSAALPPNRVRGAPLHARAAVEFPAGTLAATGTATGDRLAFDPIPGA